MALHQVIQRMLLVGAHLEALAPAPVPRPPAELQPMIEATAEAHRRFDQRAIHYGHRYRSGFWAIYLLSAIAVLCAVMPLALGWDSATHRLHSFAAVWAVAEVAVIGSVTAIYWLGQRQDWQGEWLRARTTAELTWYLPLVAPLLDFSPSRTCWAAATAIMAVKAVTAVTVTAVTVTVVRVTVVRVTVVRVTVVRAVRMVTARAASTMSPSSAPVSSLWRAGCSGPRGRIRPSLRATRGGRSTYSRDSGAIIAASRSNSTRCCTACTASPPRCSRSPPRAL
jgi:hypothetical protein